MTKRSKDGKASKSDGKAVKGKGDAKSANPFSLERDIVFVLQDERNVAMHLAMRGVSPKENWLRAEEIGRELRRIGDIRAEEWVNALFAKYGL